MAPVDRHGHLTYLPAVKTGAITLDSEDVPVSKVEAPDADRNVNTTNVCNPTGENQECKGVRKDGVAPGSLLVEEGAVDGFVSGDEAEPCVTSHSSHEDDGDLLDLLVETLDCEFDPSLIV